MRNGFPRQNPAQHARRISLADAQALSTPVNQSRHALRRAAQRNLTTTDIEYILTWGREFHRTGAVFYCLADRDIPVLHRHLPEIMRLAGAVVLANRNDEVITLYRHGRKLRFIRRKMKYRFTPGVEVIGADLEETEETE